MSENQGIRVLPLIRIPRPQLLIPGQACKTKTPTTKKLPPIIYSSPSPMRKAFQSLPPDRRNVNPPSSQLDLKHTVHEPLTPMTEKDNIYRILRNSLSRLSFKYLNVQSIADIPKNYPDEVRQIDSLYQLYCCRASPEEKTMIAKYVMSNLIRNTVPYTQQNPFSESSPIYTISNSQQLEKLHFLFQKILNDDLKIITRKFLYSLVGMLHSNVDFERKEIEKEIVFIMSNNHNTIPFLLQKLLSELIKFIDIPNQYPPYAIASILRIFVVYFNTIFNGPISSKVIFTFQNVFYPLHLSENFVSYEKPLRDISVFFMKKNPEIAQWCINYLCQHWPVSSPRKELAFLQQLENSLQYTDPDTIDKLAPKVSKILARCISSETINVSVSAILDLSSNMTLSYFDQSNKLPFLKVIVPALDSASKNWKPQVSEMADNLLSHLKEAEKSVNINDFTNLKNDKKNEEKRESTWTTIRTIARAKRTVNSQKTTFYSSLDD
ncbi:hypothetical protein M9Y10_033847 [Tritrichomonas musculus]|uniref:Phosphoprotein phosphatase n=1 Tax=Tritrichomonas musculus TaxID=1915356 RepID=A0ABR2KD99_9EUKA